MISPIANAVVIAAFGLLIGGVLGVIMYLTETGKKEEGKPEFSFRAAFEQADKDVEWMKSAPRSFHLVMAVFYGFVAMLIVVLWLTPLTMRWWIFLIAAFAGFFPSLFSTPGFRDKFNIKKT